MAEIHSDKKEAHHTERKEEKKDDSIEIPVGKYLSGVRKNPWIVSTVILGLAIIALVIIMSISGPGGSGGGTGLVSEQVAADKLVGFINAQGGPTATVVSSVKEGSLYKVTFNYQSQDIPVYVTLDGQYLITTQPIPLNATAAAGTNGSVSEPSAPANISKTSKPVADFYVFSYCPFGTQIEKALVPVYNLLKNKADINIVFIGAMHGEFEHQESLRQLCIQKNYGKDKLFAYLDKFLINDSVGSCCGADTCVTPIIESIYTQIGVDKSKINTCMTTDAEALYAANEQKAQSLGIGGSPTVTINGVQVGGNACGSNADCNPGESCVVVDSRGNKVCSLSRSPESVKESICNGFSTAPSECSQTLSTASASSGFGSTASSSSAASCG